MIFYKKKLYVGEYHLNKWTSKQLDLFDKFQSIEI
jgi:hypothetical protein